MPGRAWLLSGGLWMQPGRARGALQTPPGTWRRFLGCLGDGLQQSGVGSGLRHLSVSGTDFILSLLGVTE